MQRRSQQGQADLKESQFLIQDINLFLKSGFRPFHRWTKEAMAEFHWKNYSKNQQD